MKGIVLAGGVGSRLWPITKATSKQLLPVYDKPLIHYPISTLMLSGITEILIISTPNDQQAFQSLLGDGSQYGIRFDYATQQHPNGLAEAFIIGERFIENNHVALILGDNIFHGSGLGTQLKRFRNLDGANIFACKVNDPSQYGIIELGRDRKILSIEEKPDLAKSNYAVPGLYFYDSEVVEIAKQIKPSLRGELEITSVNDAYLQMGKLTATLLDRGTVWLDTGTHESLYSASSYVRVIEQRQGMKIGCLEEIAWKEGLISESQLISRVTEFGGSDYGRYLSSLIEK